MMNKMTKEELERIFEVPFLDYQVEFVNKLLEHVNNNEMFVRVPKADAYEAFRKAIKNTYGTKAHTVIVDEFLLPEEKEDDMKQMFEDLEGRRWVGYGPDLSEKESEGVEYYEEFKN